MQPTVILTAPVAGMVYLNGRFAGEASAERPLIAPVSPCGALYLEFRPLSGTGGALARRLVFSGGAPMADSLAEAEGLSCVAWPGGALEVECTPPDRSVEHFALEGLPCAIFRAWNVILELNGLEVSLPKGASRPSLLRLDGAAALLGEIEGGGQYLVAFTADLSLQTGFIAADRIDLIEGGMVSAVVSLGDSVGHGRLEQWLLDAGGLNRVSSENTWTGGGPRWPETAEGTLIAAVEAMLAGLPEESKGYMVPSLAAARPLDAVSDICDACVPMQYGIPDDRPCAGLLKVENDHLATVRPLYCRAEQTGGAQGPWKITWIGN